MGDYLEEILDSNDLQMELMSALDDGETLSESEYRELFLDDVLLGNLEVDEFYEE